jgi:hypothetical protein
MSFTWRSAKKSRFSLGGNLTMPLARLAPPRQQRQRSEFYGPVIVHESLPTPTENAFGATRVAYFQSVTSPSPFTAVTRVQIPSGTPNV